MIQRIPRLTKRKQNLLLKRFVVGDTAVAAAEEAQISRNTANLYFNHYRELIYDNFSRAPRFMGEVEMDQAFFGKGIKRKNIDRRVIGNPDAYGDSWHIVPKNKKSSKNKAKPIQVFGIFNRGGDVYTHIIQDASRRTLFPIIHLVVELGTMIYTDRWAAFDTLKIDGYKHKQVNHELGLVSKEGVHTGHIDSFWGQAKRHLSRYRGVSRRTFALHLKEIEVRHNHRKGKFLPLIKRLLKAAPGIEK